MTTKEKIEKALVKIDSILTTDFISSPVREELTEAKAQLESAKSDLD